MTHLEKAIAKKQAAEAAFLADPSFENRSAMNRADEEWQVALYEAGDHPAYA